MSTAIVTKFVERGRPLLFSVVVFAVAVLVLLYVAGGDGTKLSDAQMVGQIAAFLLAALGLNLLVGGAGMHSFGQGAFLGIGAYTYAYCQLTIGTPMPVSLVLAVVVPGVLGALTAVATTRMSGPQLAMVTLILAVVVQRFLAEASFLGQFGGYPNVSAHDTSLLETPSLFGIALEPPLFGGVVATALIFTVLISAACLVLCRRIMSSPWGHSLSAIKQSELLASHLGVNVYLRKIALMALASSLAGLGGACYALVFAHLQPETFTLMLGVNLIVMVILGGAGTVLGPVIGTAAIVYLQTAPSIDSLVRFQNDAISERWYLSAQGLIALAMLIALFVMPAGVVGSVGKLARRRLGLPRRKAGANASTEAALEELLRRDDTRAEPLLVIDGISRHFGGVRAVDDVSIGVRAGQVLALIGPNGAGKSTVVNVVSGVYPTSTGSIRLGDTDLTALPAHRRSRAGLARTFQTPMIAPELTVWENVAVGCHSTGGQSLGAAVVPSRRWLSARAAERRDVAAAINLLGLDEFAGQTADELSYGQQRSLELARALVSRPRVLVLDEPAAGLNPSETAEVSDLLIRLRSHGLAIVVVEHHMDLVRAVSDEVACMIDGRLLTSGTPDAVLADERVVEAYLGAPSTLTEETSHA